MADTPIRRFDRVTPTDKPIRRDRSKGAEPRETPNKKYFKDNAFKQTDRLTDRDMEYINKITERLKEPAAIGSAGAAGASMVADLKGSTDPYTIDPDTSMMQGMAEGGSVRGQKAIQVKKKPFKGIF